MRGVRDGGAGRLGPCLATAEPLPLELQGDDRLLERLQGAPENERNEGRGRPGLPPFESGGFPPAQNGGDPIKKNNPPCMRSNLIQKQQSVV